MTARQQPEPENYVDLIQDDRVRIQNVSTDLARRLANLGGRQQVFNNQPVWLLQAKDEQALGALLGKLRDAGVRFVGGAAGWPPAEIFDDLRERGLVSGSFEEITWRGSGQWTSRTR